MATDTHRARTTLFTAIDPGDLVPNSATSEQ